MGCVPTRPSAEPGVDNQTKSNELGNENRKKVFIRLSPALSSVDREGIGRPARVDVSDRSQERKKTGEEPTIDMHEDFEIRHGNLGLGLSRDEIEEIISKLDIANGQFYEDPEFPVEQALFYSERPLHELDQYSWKRPFELSPTSAPELYVDGTSRRDVIQGILGDCWLLSACAAIAKREDLLHRVVPPNQVLYGPDYTGLVEVRLWRYGRFVSVFIDDRLPQKQGNYCYARSADPNEFWAAMIEKAFAKIHGSYEAIEGGMPIEALVDMTGGLAERYELKHEVDSNETLYRFLRRSFASQAFITCSRKGNWKNAHKADKNGLVQGHAYTITGIYRVDLKKPKEHHKKRVHLIRVRNPWGDSNEWKGEWCDGHSNWDLVKKESKRDMGLHHQIDGEFWMDFSKDFCRQFEEVSICTLGPDFNHDGTVDQPDTVKIIFGEWIPGVNAGGCRNNLKQFATNPQYLLRVYEADDTHLPVRILEKDSSKDSANFSFDDEEPPPVEKEMIEKDLKDPKCQVIISLAQEYRRSLRDRKVKLHQIGFCVYRAGHSSNENESGSYVQRHQEKFFSYNYDVGNSGPYINYREVIGRFELSPGDYIVIPATFEENIANKFMMRFYAGKNIDVTSII